MLVGEQHAAVKIIKIGCGCRCSEGRVWNGKQAACERFAFFDQYCRIVALSVVEELFGGAGHLRQFCDGFAVPGGGGGVLRRRRSWRRAAANEEKRGGDESKAHEFRISGAFAGTTPPNIKA